jgi:hypothetical protein
MLLMRKRAVATLFVLPLGLACGESPVTPGEAPDVHAPADLAAANLLVLNGEQVAGLAAVLDDARVRVLPGLEHKGLELALARVSAALAGSDRAELDAAVAAALASLNEAGTAAESAAELDVIRLALGDVTGAAHPQAPSQLLQ